MKYLLDVNALVAWWHHTHPRHSVFHAWGKKARFSNLATCAHAELGFMRISMQVYRYTLADAQSALAQMMKKTGGRIADCPPPLLAAWASTGAKTTDAYLCQLAAAHKMQLATFDSGIKDSVAFLIS